MPANKMEKELSFLRSLPKKTNLGRFSAGPSWLNITKDTPLYFKGLIPWAPPGSLHVLGSDVAFGGYGFLKARAYISYCSFTKSFAEAQTVKWDNVPYYVTLGPKLLASLLHYPVEPLPGGAFRFLEKKKSKWTLIGYLDRETCFSKWSGGFSYNFSWPQVDLETGNE